MTEVVRFTIGVGSDWTVYVVGPRGPVLPAPPPLWTAEGPALPPEISETRDSFLRQLWSPSMSVAIPDIYDRIFIKEDYSGTDVEDLGRFLFDRLIGLDTWNAIRAVSVGADVIELALQFTREHYDLHRFPWELMHDPNGFLAQGIPMASVTRVVEQKSQPGSSPTAPPDPFRRPPRLLFAIGTHLTDRRIRPGAEIFGLLRQLNTRGLTVNLRVLRSTSAPELRRAIDKYDPDLIHFICHGDIEEIQGSQRGFLEFKNEDKDGVVHRFAADLLGDLKSGNRVPTVVILSACFSATVPNIGPVEEVWRAASVDCIGSLAAELVAGGLPIVVGMGGRVADSACRVFTRFFGEALVRGDPLVAAMARGRRAAFMDGTPEQADWAFPVLFLAPRVDPTYSPVELPVGVPDPCQALALRVQAYGVPKYPVFCGRHEFLERFERLFQSEMPPILPIFTQDGTPGLGRTRLLKELAAHALRNGHIPCLVVGTGEPGKGIFLKTTDLAVAILRGIVDARMAFCLPLPSESSVLARLIEAKKRPDLEASLSSSITRSKLLSVIEEAVRAKGDDPSDEVYHAALQEDFKALIDAARTADIPNIGSNSRVVLLLDDVDRYAEPVITSLLYTLIQEFGLGTPNEPIPVILCYSKGTGKDLVFDEARERIGNRAEKLKTFSEEDDEDLLAYEQVLLFPDESGRYPREIADFIRNKLNVAIEGNVACFAINHRARPEVKKPWIDHFRLSIQGIPQRMEDRQIYIDALAAYRGGFLILGDDEARLRKM